MVIAIASQKGGTGKTTTSIALSAGLARKGKTVLLVDIDSQANSSKVVLPKYQNISKEQTLYATILQKQPLSIHETSIPHLAVAPSHILLSNTDVELTAAIDHREARLKRELDKVKPHYEYIFIDCPPALSWLTVNAFTAADKVIIPVSPGYFELDSIKQISKTLAEIQSWFNPSLQLAGYLYTMAEPTINSQTSLSVLRQTYTDAVLKTVIPRNTDIKDAHFNKQDIFAFNAKSKSALAYEKLIEELFAV